MEQKDRDTLKHVFGEAIVQSAGLIILALFGGVALAYAFIGWGAISLIFPLGFMAYSVFRKSR